MRTGVATTGMGGNSVHEPLILAVDQGTSGTKVLLFDSKGEVCATRQRAQAVLSSAWLGGARSPRDLE